MLFFYPKPSFTHPFKPILSSRIRNTEKDKNTTTTTTLTIPQLGPLVRRFIAVISHCLVVLVLHLLLLLLNYLLKIQCAAAAGRWLSLATALFFFLLALFHENFFIKHFRTVSAFIFFALVC